MRTIRLAVEYDGTHLCGWQRQPNGPTVQGHLETALASLLQTPTPVVGASRTDSGVHARGQVAAFRTDKAIPVDGIRRGLNSLLPAAIAIVAADEVEAAFHPRYASTGKHYRYLLLARPDRSPHWAARAWHRPVRLDLDAVAAAASHLVGLHDFAAFRATGCSARTTRRRVDAIALSRLVADPDVVAVDVRGNGFLRHMVRIMVGTLVEVAEGRLSPPQVAEILASHDRTRGGQTAPAHGLELMAVSYEGPPRPGV